MADAAPSARPVVYWHRDLPPLDAEVVDEHTLEATSRRVPGVLEHHDDRWRDCYEDLRRNAEARLRQELARLGGDYAHVVDEWVDSRRDDAAGESWLRGRFRYTRSRRIPADA